MSAERRIPGEPRWESEWRSHEQTHLGRSQTDMPPITPDQERQIHTAYEALPAVVQEYVDVTNRLQNAELLPDDRRRYQKEQQTRLVQIIRDDGLAKSLGIYTARVNSIRMGS